MENNNERKLLFRHPVVSDASAISEMVKASQVLDINSTYLYLLLCRDFSHTCLVAESDSKIVGLLTGYIPPQQHDVAFVWQIAVSPSVRGQGIGLRLLQEFVSRVVPAGAQWLEATIAPSNQASRRLFASLASKLEVSMTESPGFRADDFGTADQHEEEPLIRIGPLPTSAPHR